MLDASLILRKNNFGSSCMEGLRIIFSDQNVFLLGAIQVKRKSSQTSTVGNVLPSSGACDGAIPFSRQKAYPARKIFPSPPMLDIPPPSNFVIINANAHKTTDFPKNLQHFAVNPGVVHVHLRVPVDPRAGRAGPGLPSPRDGLLLLHGQLAQVLVLSSLGLPPAKLGIWGLRFRNVVQQKLLPGRTD